MVGGMVQLYHFQILVSPFLSLCLCAHFAPLAFAAWLSVLDDILGERWQGFVSLAVDGKGTWASLVFEALPRRGKRWQTLRALF